MAKSNALPKWVVEGIQDVKFTKPKIQKSTGYILEVYEKDLKVDVQLYDAVEDGRHIVTMELSKKIDINTLERSITYEFVFEEAKGKIDPKVVEYLKEAKDVDMNFVYQFTLTKLSKIDTD
ncbi:MAG: hypothetical protein K8823_38 [Cenarchaeum symbiont of Oopsacas minuta]|nr:hypothetical protein [Cenarchaeum symbiont of Oopsacas minuta]